MMGLHGKQARRDIGCSRARELFYGSAAGGQSGEEAHLLSLHQASCPACGPEFEEWRRLRSALQESRVAPAADFKAGVMARIQDLQAEPKPARTVPWGTVWQQRWTKGVAAAAVILALTAGAARLLPATGMIAFLGHNRPSVVTPAPTPVVQPEATIPPVTPDTTPPVKVEPEKTGTDGNDSVVKPSVPPATPGANVQDTGGGNPGERVFTANQKRVITTTTIKVTVDSIEQARSSALCIASSVDSSLSLAQPTQASGRSILFMRFTVDPGKIGVFLDRLIKLGTVVTEYRDSEDVTSKFGSKLEAYRALKAQQAAAPEDEKQQYESQLEDLEKQLQGWDDTYGKQVVLLWLEQ